MNATNVPKEIVQPFMADLTTAQAITRLARSGNWPTRKTIPPEIAQADYVCLTAFVGQPVTSFMAWCS